MITLDGWIDYARLFALAAALGAVGGLAFELMQTRRGGGSGQIERPKRSKGFWDLGVWASMIIGAVAAVAALWVFPPEQTTNVVGGTVTSITTRYDLIKVVGLSLIIGSAGSSFLTAMQARATALVKAEEKAATERVATGQVAGLKDQINAGASKETLVAAASAAQQAIQAVSNSGPSNPQERDF